MNIHTHSVLYQNNISVYQLSSQVLLKGSHCLSFPKPFLAGAIIAHSSLVTHSMLDPHKQSKISLFWQQRGHWPLNIA